MTDMEMTSIRATTIAVLRRKFEQRSIPLAALESEDRDLVGLGLLESVDVLDVLMEVESACGREFDPEHLDFEGGLTVQKLVAAFSA